MRTYQYEVEGTGADGQTWSTQGTIESAPGDFPLLMEPILRQSFFDLTNGKAVFGRPGEGCAGPYAIARFEVKVVAS